MEEYARTNNVHTECSENKRQWVQKILRWWTGALQLLCYCFPDFEVWPNISYSTTIMKMFIMTNVLIRLSTAVFFSLTRSTAHIRELATLPQYSVVLPYAVYLITLFFSAYILWQKRAVMSCVISEICSFVTRFLKPEDRRHIVSLSALVMFISIAFVALRILTIDIQDFEVDTANYWRDYNSTISQETFCAVIRVLNIVERINDVGKALFYGYSILLAIICGKTACRINEQLIDKVSQDVWLVAEQFRDMVTRLDFIMSWITLGWCVYTAGSVVQWTYWTSEAFRYTRSVDGEYLAMLVVTLVILCGYFASAVYLAEQANVMLNLIETIRDPMDEIRHQSQPPTNRTLVWRMQSGCLTFGGVVLTREKALEILGALLVYAVIFAELAQS